MAEMVKTSYSYCRKCKYSAIHNANKKGEEGTTQPTTCNYLLETKKRRGCPVGLCDKFEPRDEKGLKKKRGINF